MSATQSVELPGSKINNLILTILRLFRWVLIRAIFLSFGLLFALILVELVLRVLPISKAISWNDRPKLYFSHEGVATLQELTHKVPKPANLFRIAVVGDSFSFAPYMQFDDTFPKRLERYLNLNKQQQAVEVVNYGVPRYSTTHEVAVVERALAEGADLIILQITMNDPEVKPYIPDGTLLTDEQIEKSKLSKFFEHSRLFRLLEARIENSRSHNKYREYFLKLFRDWDNLAPFLDALKKIKSLTSAKQVPLVAAVFPLFGYSFDDNYPLFEIHHKLGDILIDNKIKFFDLSSAYYNIPLDRLQVIPGVDRHPNEIAHRIAAERILAWLTEEKLVPQSAIPKEQFSNRIGIKK